MLVVAGACGRAGFDPTGDGGAIDGPRDAGSDSTTVASLCGPTGLRLCDGFEAPAFDGRWLFDNVAGSTTRTMGRSYRGDGSLYLQTDEITTLTSFPRATLLTYDALPFVGTIHVRAFVYLIAPISSNFLQLLNFANDVGRGMSVGVRNGFVVNNDYTEGNFVQSTTVVFPTDRWVCVEYEVPSDTTENLRIYLDGVEVTDVVLPKPTPQPQQTHIYVGLSWPNMHSSLPPSSAWFDELVIDDAPIGCAR